MQALLRGGPFAGQQEIESAAPYISFGDESGRHEYVLRPEVSALPERAVYDYTGATQDEAAD
jgi:hypothetical protein